MYTMQTFIGVCLLYKQNPLFLILSKFKTMPKLKLAQVAFDSRNTHLVHNKLFSPLFYEFVLNFPLERTNLLVSCNAMNVFQARLYMYVCFLLSSLTFKASKLSSSICIHDPNIHFIYN